MLPSLAPSHPFGNRKAWADWSENLGTSTRVISSTSSSTLERSSGKVFTFGTGPGGGRNADFGLGSTSHDQKIVVLDFSYGIEGAELFA